MYCNGCIRDFVGEEAINKIAETDSWLCFLCTPQNDETHGLLKTKSDWRRNIVGLFQPESNVQVRKIPYVHLGLCTFFQKKKKKMNVICGVIWTRVKNDTGF